MAQGTLDEAEGEGDGRGERVYRDCLLCHRQVLRDPAVGNEHQQGSDRQLCQLLRAPRRGLLHSLHAYHCVTRSGNPEITA